MLSVFFAYKNSGQIAKSATLLIAIGVVKAYNVNVCSMSEHRGSNESEVNLW